MENCQTSGNQTVNTNTAQAVENIEKQVEELVKKVLNVSIKIDEVHENIDEVRQKTIENGVKIEQVQTDIGAKVGRRSDRYKMCLLI